MRKGRPKSAPSRVIASRVLNEVGGSLREIEVAFEAPWQDRRGHWNCRHLIKGLGKQRRHVGKGEDSLQALPQAVEEARVALDITDGRFAWLEDDPDRAGTGIPRYVPMFKGPQFEAHINLAIERESKRYHQTVLRNRKAHFAACEAEVNERRAALAVLAETLARRKAGAAEWEADLKKCKPKMVRRSSS